MEYLLLLCVAVSSYDRKGVSTAAAVRFDALLMIGNLRGPPRPCLLWEMA
jgi:hypothetical protein